MTPEIAEESAEHLEEYARISIAFEVNRVVDVCGAPGGYALSERSLDAPYVKDYDTVPGDAPLHWAGRFDLSNWRVFTARLDGRRVGGAVVAHDTPGLDMLEGRRDVAVLWDIRVSPEARGRGVGSALFRAAAAWARARGCRLLKVETQNINVPACRFYARHRCVLGTVRPFAYHDLPEEVQLIWHKELP